MELAAYLCFRNRWKPYSGNVSYLCISGLGFMFAVEERFRDITISLRYVAKCVEDRERGLLEGNTPTHRRRCPNADTSSKMPVTELTTAAMLTKRALKTLSSRLQMGERYHELKLNERLKTKTKAHKWP